MNEVLKKKKKNNVKPDRSREEIYTERGASVSLEGSITAIDLDVKIPHVI